MAIKTKSVKDKPKPADGIRILVSRYHPRKSFKELRIDRWMKPLGPSPELLRDWKSGKVTEEEYEIRYRAEIRNQKETVEKLVSLASSHVITLLCFEKEGEFCHRHILRNIIEEKMSQISQQKFSLNIKNSSQPEQINVRICEHEVKLNDWIFKPNADFTYDWHNQFNKEFFNSKLPLAVLSFAKTRHATLGHYVLGRNSIGVRDNINLNSVHLDSKKWQTLRTLLHEMAHQWIETYGHPGKSAKCNYHNKEFRSLVESFGIPCTSRGYSIDPPEDPFISFLRKNGIEVNLEDVESSTVQITGGHSKLKKFSCECNPPINVRVADSRFSAKCNHCGANFKPAEAYKNLDLQGKGEELKSEPIQILPADSSGDTETGVSIEKLDKKHKPWEKMNNQVDPKILSLIRTKPEITKDAKSFDWMVQQKVQSGEWRLELVPAEVVELPRPIEVYRTERKDKLIKPWINRAEATYCCEHWADLKIGRGACGFRCRACFLNLTHRGFCDPSRHVLYENVEDYKRAVEQWLKTPNRRNLGLGIDCSDSLLYEGVTGHTRRLIPLFSNPSTNPHGCKIILLTKSRNVHYLEGLPTANVIVSFSINPEKIADIWEGKWDDGLRITPSIPDRLQASLKTEKMGFEVRWRVDPIFMVENWRETYKEFLKKAAQCDHFPTRITLGMYREMGRGLLTMGKKWGLPPLEFKPPKMVKQGMHYHLPEEERITTYKFIKKSIEKAWEPTGKSPIVALCKETAAVREATGLTHRHCNCE